MQLTAAGDIRRYEWRELSPGKAESVVLPNDDFLTEKWRTGPEEKEHEQPYLLPVSTIILDDYFFIHREVLAWKFLGASCKQDKGQVQCPLKQRAQFATMNPHQHSSAPLSAEFLGREKVSLKSGEQEKAKVKKGKGHLDALRKWEGDQSWDDGKDKAGKIVDQAAVDRLKSKLDDISSIAALLECAKTAGDRANVFDGTLSSRVDESAKSNASISDFFKNPECSAGAIVQPLGTKDKPGKIYVGPAFFDPEGKAGVLHGYDRDGRALMIMHECVHAFGNLTDDEFGGSSHLTEFLIDKCYPAKKGDMGNLVNHV